MEGTNVPFTVEVPEMENVVQGEEIFVVHYNGEKKRIRAHDYHEIYAIPGLYEHLFYDTYKCCSPEVICSLLNEEIQRSDVEPSDLNVLDVGAGNGMVGEKLSDIGVNSLVGIDIIPEAAEATERDRPGIYDQYYVEDLTQLPQNVTQEINEQNPNCLTIVAALGFDDIPPQAFAEAYNMISDNGWVAFNIKDEFLCEGDCTGFTSLIQEMLSSGVMDMKTRHRYRHRLCADGTPLHYYAIVGEKQSDINEEMLNSFF